MDLTDVIGDFGRIQKRVLLILVVRSVALCSVGFTAHFTTLNVDHWCSPQPNVSPQEWKECCIPKDERGYSRCSYFNPSGNQTFGNESESECSSWYYDEKESHLSIVSEWDLVCDRRWQVSLAFSSFSLGNLIAYAPSGYFSDRFGRRPSIIFGTSVVLAFTLACAFSTSITMFVIFRFIVGMAYPFVQHIILTIYMEMVGKKERGYSQYIYNGAWGLGTTLMAGLSLALPNWRMFILVASCTPLIIFLVLITIGVPESPRWLLSTKKYTRAETEIQKFAAGNNIIVVDSSSVMERLKEKIEMSDGPKKNNVDAGTFRDFFKSRRLLVIAIVLCIINVSKAFLGSGFTISLRHFGGIVQINYIVHGLTSMASSILFEMSTVFIKLRRITMAGCYVIAAVMFISIIFISDDYYWLKLSIAMTGNVVKKVASASLYLIGSEIFPTNMRGKGVAILMMAGRVGNLLAPLTDLLAYQYGKDSPLIMFACMCIMLFFLLSFLPDSENFLLPDSVREADKTVKESDRKRKASLSAEVTR